MRRCLAFLVLGLAIGCGNDSPSAPTLASVAGTWVLASVNGSPAPFVFSQSGTTKSEIVSNVVTITSSGGYTSVFQVRTTVNGQATTMTTTDAGSVSLQGTTIRVQSSGGTVYNGTISGDTLTLTMDTFLLAFRRQ